MVGVQRSPQTGQPGQAGPSGTANATRKKTSRAHEGPNTEDPEAAILDITNAPGTTKPSSEQLVLLGGMRAILKEELDKTETRLAGRIGGVEDQLGTLRGDMTGLEKRIEEVERRVDSQIDKIVADRYEDLRGPPTRGRPGGVESPTTRETRYWKARKSLRMWPIKGEGEEMMADLQKFLAQRLRLGEDVLADAEDCRIRRVPRGQNSGIQWEAAVEFPTVDLRDVVRAAAFNLAGYEDCGIRLEIAHHLMPNFRALSRASYKLKQKFSACKRNIKYEDEKADLVLDFKTSPTTNWRRLHPEQARQMAKEEGDLEIVSATDMSELLEAEETLTDADDIGA